MIVLAACQGSGKEMPVESAMSPTGETGESESVETGQPDSAVESADTGLPASDTGGYCAVDPLPAMWSLEDDPCDVIRGLQFGDDECATIGFHAGGIRFWNGQDLVVQESYGCTRSGTIATLHSCSLAEFPFSFDLTTGILTAYWSTFAVVDSAWAPDTGTLAYTVHDTGCY
jgi:hypothetical protein